VEIAISYQRLMDECNLTHEALSERVGKDRSTVTNYVRLLKLPAQIQASVKEGIISMGHARALAGIENIALQLKIFKEAIDQGLSVRGVEQLIKSYVVIKPSNSTPPKTEIHPEIKKIKDQLGSLLGTKIDIKRDQNGKGAITILFNSDGELNKITEILMKDN